MPVALITRWYGCWVMPDGSPQCVEARTLPRPEETTYQFATDPVRLSWPSR